MIKKLNDIMTNVEIVGNGKPILLLHGLGLDHSIWMPMAQLYQDQAQFILPDLRGHGQTETGDAKGTIEQFADDLAMLVSAIKLEKVVLGGHSMGGYVALAFAEKFPDLLSGLVMIASNARVDPPDKKAVRLADAEAVLSQGSQVVAHSLAPRLSNDEGIVQTMTALIMKTEDVGLSNVQKAIANRPARLNLLSELACPVLAVAGKDDKISTLEFSREMAEKATEGHFVAIPGAGHMPMLEAARTLGALLVAL